MLAAGDFDLMLPLFDTYERLRPFAEARAKLYHQAEGSYCIEAFTVWGTYSNNEYGWNRKGKNPNCPDCGAWRHAWNQGPELLALMLDYYDYTGDSAFCRERLLPMAVSILKYFDTRFKKDANGRIILDPTQVVETYVEGVINDTPTVAGLNEVPARLCALPEALTTPEQRTFFAHMKACAPEIPMREATLEGKTVRYIAPA